MPSTAPTRCAWCGTDPLYIAYHDHEWGVPSHDDAHLFEMLILEGQQAGLSWLTILKKRENFRAALDGFDPARIARFTPARIEKLMGNAGIIRNRLKLNAAVKNARAFLDTQAEFGSFERYIWSFVDGVAQQNRFQSPQDIPVTTPASDAMSRALKQRGFTFVGSTICYSFMQAVGMVNDHVCACHRHQTIAALRNIPTP
jgi:DNA-3-methyladenine glycosylase I